MADLAKRAKRGDADAYARLVRMYSPSLYRVARSYLHDEADVADAMQEAITVAWEKLPTLRDTKLFRTWVTRILMNICARMLKVRARTVPADPTADDRLRQMATGDDADAVVGRLAFEQMMDALDEPYRVCLTLYYGEGYNISEIAQLQEITVDAARQRLARGRRKVAERFFSDLLPGRGA